MLRRVLMRYFYHRKTREKMEKKRDTFIFYRSFYDSIKELEAMDRLAIHEAIAEYSLNFQEPDLKGVSKAIWCLIKPHLDSNNQKWENGKKAKRKRTVSKPKAKRKQTVSKQPAYVDVDVDVDVDKTHEREHQLFGVPSIKPPQSALKCQEYFTGLKAKEGYEYDAEDVANRFFDHYAAKGWKIGGDAITNWTYQANKWARSEKPVEVSKNDWKPSW